MAKKDTINLKTMASLIHYQNPKLKVKDIQAMLEAEIGIISLGLETGQRIKMGKLFIIEPYIKPAQRHYSGTRKEGPKFIMLPERLRFRFKPLKALKKIESEYRPIDN